MAKIQIKSEKLTPFGGIFHVMDLFERHLSHIIDGTLGKRSVSIGYDYSEIIRSLMCVYFCGGSCVEDVSNHLGGWIYLSMHHDERLWVNPGGNCWVLQQTWSQGNIAVSTYTLYGVRGCCTPKDANRKDRSRFWLQFSQRNRFWVKTGITGSSCGF